MRREILLGLVAIGTLCGASDVPKDAKFGPDYAEVTFLKGTKKNGFDQGGSLQFYKVRAGKCEPPQELASFHALSGKTKKVLLKTGERVVINSRLYITNTRLRAIHPGGAAFSADYDQCRTIAVFTPQPLGRYQIEQKLGERGCYLAVTDLATGAEVTGTEDTKGASCVGGT